jgi:hypothetical protein
MKVGHPRAIDPYIDFFGGGTWMRLAALDTRTLATPDSRTVERRDGSSGPKVNAPGV